MKDLNMIKKIIKSFRMIIHDIFNLSERRDFVKMIFSSGYEDVLNGRVNEYFNKEILAFPQDTPQLNQMRESILYLLEKIHDSNQVLKLLFYLTLFADKNGLDNHEIKTIFDF